MDELLVAVLVDNMVGVPRRKPKVDHVQRRMIENIAALAIFWKLATMICHQVVKLQIIVDVAGCVDLLEHGEDVQAELIAAAAGHLVFASFEIGLKILAVARHDYVRVSGLQLLTRLSLDLLIFIVEDKYGPGLNDLGSLRLLMLRWVQLHRIATVPNTTHGIDFIIKEAVHWLQLHRERSFFVSEVDDLEDLTVAALAKEAADFVTARKDAA